MNWRSPPRMKKASLFSAEYLSRTYPCPGHMAVDSGFTCVIAGTSICASRCRKARTSLFSVTMLQIIQIPTPPAIGNHSQAISSSHIGDLLCTPSRARLGHAGPYGFTIIQCIVCQNVSGAASGIPAGLSGSSAAATVLPLGAAPVPLAWVTHGGARAGDAWGTPPVSHAWALWPVGNLQPAQERSCVQGYSGDAPCSKGSSPVTSEDKRFTDTLPRMPFQEFGKILILSLAAFPPWLALHSGGSRCIAPALSRRQGLPEFSAAMALFPLIIRAHPR